MNLPAASDLPRLRAGQEKNITQPSGLPLQLKDQEKAKKMAIEVTLEEALLWSESVDNLLYHKAGQVVFRNFLRKEFSEENIDFWLACEAYRKINSPEEMASTAGKIYSEFIEVKAPKEINIDFKTRDDIAKGINEPTQSSFDAAQNIIYGLMAKDPYPRFLKSDNYLELINKKKNNQQK